MDYSDETDQFLSKFSSNGMITNSQKQNGKMKDFKSNIVMFCCELIITYIYVFLIVIQFFLLILIL